MMPAKTQIVQAKASLSSMEIFSMFSMAVMSNGGWLVLLVPLLMMGLRDSFLADKELSVEAEQDRRV